MNKKTTLIILVKMISLFAPLPLYAMEPERPIRYEPARLFETTADKVAKQALEIYQKQRYKGLRKYLQTLPEELKLSILSLLSVNYDRPDILLTELSFRYRNNPELAIKFFHQLPRVVRLRLFKELFPEPALRRPMRTLTEEGKRLVTELINTITDAEELSAISLIIRYHSTILQTTAENKAFDENLVNARTA